MKPLYHPTVTDITVEGILYALSDPIRVEIFTTMLKAECPKICANFRNLNNGTLAKSTLSHHFKVLREAGLVRSVRKGVEIHNVTRCEEIKDRFGEMINKIIEAYQQQNKSV